MEPTLLDGDQLWVKYLEPAGVRAGDIVALQDPVLGRIGLGDKVGVTFLRVRFTGQIVRFFKTIPGMTLLLGGAVTLSVALWIARRRRLAWFAPSN
jgi:hypothetical protein